MKLENWVDNTIKRLEKEGVTVRLSNTVRVRANDDDPDPCEGYFSDKPSVEIAIATKNPEWRKIFLHEYCHYRQFKLKTSQWTAVGNNDLKLTAWLGGKNAVLKDVSKWIESIRAMEKQCEKLATIYIKNSNFFSVKDYIKGANAYLYFYTVLLKTRKWYKNPPDASTKLKSLMPIRFLKDYTQVSPKMEALFIKECY